MIVIDCEQNTPEWMAARLGRITASNMEKIITPTGKKSTQCERYISKLIAERITGDSSSWQGNIHTDRGHELEDEAAAYYSMLRGVELQKVGFFLSDDGIMGSSPDRLVDDDGMLEIKTCLPELMVEQYEKQKLEQEHKPQTQCSLCVTGRVWIDTMLYCPKMKPLVVRSYKDSDFTAEMVRLVMEANSSMNRRMSFLIENGYAESTAKESDQTHD